MPEFLKTSLKIAAALAAAVFLAGCLQDNGLTAPSVDPAPQQQTEAVSMRIRMRVGAVNALSKGQTISLSKMIVIMTSNGSPADTVRDTLKTSGTTPTIAANSTTQQNISKNYLLKGLRSWKIKVSIRDSKDSLIHVDSATTPLLRLADTAVVNLGLNSRFAMYDARFLNLPDSISSTSGNLKQQLRINRLVLKIDGVIVKDSTSSPKAYFDSLKTSTISYDYVSTLSSHTVEMSAYGPMGSWNTANPLYTGTRTITSTAGVNDSLGVTLNWVGPTTGGGSITATLSRVGKVTITGKLPGTP